MHDFWQDLVTKAPSSEVRTGTEPRSLNHGTSGLPLSSSAKREKGVEGTTNSRRGTKLLNSASKLQLRPSHSRACSKLVYSADARDKSLTTCPSFSSWIPPSSSRSSSVESRIPEFRFTINYSLAE
ncbi:hypothetical protein SAY87_015327 [Trapa incisa]|uniref:Uncharacterized protein n=1 Tax=Trapa incisa TaxID=236973 RepID=A0AAN7GQ04_9MYRT|nr:hypothetical protein SAY87_015327 [Trapa incisa]